MNLLYLFVAIFLLYIVFAPRFAAWFYRPVLFPRLPMAYHTETPCIEHIKGKAVNFDQADGNKLCAWFFCNPEASYTILVSHGNMGNIESHNYLTEGLLKTGNSVFIYDYSGYGASSGLPNLSVVTRDAEAAYDYLIEHEQLKPENIVFYGESIGVAITAYLATVRKAKAVICQSGFVSLRKIATEKMQLLKLYPNWLFPPNFLDTAKSLKNINVPFLLIHGTKDIIVPLEHAEILFKAANLPKKFVVFPGCGHKDMVLADPYFFANTIQSFLKALPEAVSISQ